MPVARYSQPAIWLHWVMAVLMIFMLFWGEGLIRVPRGTSLTGWKPSAHASLGLMILLLGLARLLWRLGNPPPPLPQAMPRWQVIASHATHRAFYALMIALPLTGLLAIVPYGEEHLESDRVTVFGLFPAAFLPDLGGWTGNAHTILSFLGKVLVVVHGIAVLKHQFWDKAGILSRMRPL